jgi:hypothetical protein
VNQVREEGEEASAMILSTKPLILCSDFVVIAKTDKAIAFAGGGIICL